MGVYSSNLNNFNNHDYFPYSLDSDEIDTSLINNVDEAASEIIIQTEQNWYTMMKAVGISELSAIETNGDVIYEAANIGSFFTAIKNFFKKLFQKVAALFKTFAMKLYAGTRDAKTFCDKYKEQINTLTVPSDFEYQGYKFTHINEAHPFKNKNDTDDIESIEHDIDTTDPTSDSIKKRIEEFADADKQKDKKEDIRGNILRGKGKIDASEWDEEVFKYFHGEQTEKDTIDNISPSSYRDDIINSSKIKSVVDADFTEFKANYNNLMAKLDKKEKDLQNQTPVEDVNGNKVTDKAVEAKLKITKIWSEQRKFEYECITTVYNAQLKAIEEQNRQYKAVLVKLLSKSRMGTKKLDENAEFGVSHYNALDNINFI